MQSSTNVRKSQTVTNFVDEDDEEENTWIYDYYDSFQGYSVILVFLFARWKWGNG